MNGEYSPGEPKQEITLTIRFKVKHNPGNEGHLKQLLKSGYTTIIGERVYEEEGRLCCEI